MKMCKSLIKNGRELTRNNSNRKTPKNGIKTLWDDKKY